MREGRFSLEFHEPFHADYLQDDIAAALAERGFAVERREEPFVSTLVVAYKPHDAEASSSAAC